MKMDERAELEILDRFEELNQVGISLSREKNIGRLLETILVAAMNITRADAGTLYLLRGGELHFEIILSFPLFFVFQGLGVMPPRFAHAES
jgi:hypothetical protein